MGNKLITYAIYAIVIWWVMGKMGYSISKSTRTWNQYPGGGGGGYS